MKWQYRDDYQLVLKAWRPLVSARISRRQLEVIYLVSVGLSNKDIGNICGVGEKTVKSHISLAMREVGTKNRSELMLWAFNNLILEQQV